MMENAVNISRMIADAVESQVSSSSELEGQSVKIINQPQPGTKKAGDVMPKFRLYEVANEMKINSKEIMAILQKAGYNVSSHMNTLTAEQIDYIKQSLAVQEVSLSEPEEFSNSFPAENLDESCDFDRWVENLKQAHPYMAVRTLHEKGYTITQIARILERGQGEISLILNLSNKSKVV